MPSVRQPAIRVSPGTAATIIGALIASLWLIEAFDVASGGALDDVGIVPRDFGSLPEIFFAPLLHHGWGHLIGNTVPLACLGALIMLSGVPRWFNVTMISVIFSGLAVWLFSPAGTVTAGASGVVFGYLTYLLARGFFITPRPSRRSGAGYSSSGSESRTASRPGSSSPRSPCISWRPSTA